MNNTDNSKDKSNIFKKFTSKLTNKSIPSIDHLIADEIGKQPSIFKKRNPLFLCRYYQHSIFEQKRNFRAPLAREVMRSLLHKSDLFGSIRPSARGISDAYDLCAFDKRMVHRASLQGLEISGHSRRANTSELSAANLIVPLDQESEQYSKSRTFYIRGKVLPISIFFNTENLTYIPDPFDFDECIEMPNRYDSIINLTKIGCAEILESLPSLILS